LLPKEDYFSQALYTFDIGQNDLTAGYKLNMTTEQVKAYVPDLLGQLSNTIRVKQTHISFLIIIIFFFGVQVTFNVLDGYLYSMLHAERIWSRGEIILGT
jgi:hypothetical protein